MTEALAYAHGEGVIHRDLKPSNVLVGSFGETVVIDWGLAKYLRDQSSDEASVDIADDEPSGALTADGHVLGTPQYMPPEQARGLVTDERADVYALGACVYHALSGTAPYAARSGREVIAKLLAVPPPPLREVAPEVPYDLAAIVAKAMARDRADRYATAKVMADDLNRFVEGRLVAAHTYTLGQLTVRWIARNRALFAVATGCLLVLLSLTGIAIKRITRERDRARLAEIDALEQQHAAEVLVWKLLPELWTHLVPVGRYDAFSTIAAPLLDYYDRDAKHESIGSIWGRAETLNMLGFVDEARLDFDKATSRYEQAVAQADRARTLSPDSHVCDPTRAQALSRLALVAEQRGRLDDAIRYSDDAASTFATLPDPRDRLRIPFVMMVKGDVLLEKGNINQALDVLDGAIASFREHAGEKADRFQDDMRYGLGFALYYRTTALLQIGRVEEARREATEVMHIRRELQSEDTQNRTMTFDVAYGLHLQALVEDRLGRETEALAKAAEARSLVVALLRESPENGGWRGAEADFLAHECKIYQHLQKWAEAVRKCESALADREILWKGDSSPTSVRRIAEISDSLGRALLGAGRMPEAHEASMRAADSWRGFNSEAVNLNEDPPLSLARLELAKGETDSAAQNALQGRDRWRERVAASPENVHRADGLVVADILVGDVAIVRHDTVAAREAFQAAHLDCESLVERALKDAEVSIHCAEARTKLSLVVSSVEERKALRASARTLLGEVPVERIRLLAAEPWTRSL